MPAQAGIFRLEQSPRNRRKNFLRLLIVGEPFPNGKPMPTGRLSSPVSSVMHLPPLLT
jgi:hypothetical protein